MSKRKECDYDEPGIAFHCPVNISRMKRTARIRVSSKFINLVDFEIKITEEPELPLEFIEGIEDMGGYEIKLVIEKQLCEIDLKSLSIPENQIRKEAMDFVIEKEAGLLELRGMPVLVVDPRLREFNLILNKGKRGKCSVYNLVDQWNSIVQQNDLKPNDKVQLWSFRNIDDELCFALVKLQQESVNQENKRH